MTRAPGPTSLAHEYIGWCATQGRWWRITPLTRAPGQTSVAHEYVGWCAAEGSCWRITPATGTRCGLEARTDSVSDSRAALTHAGTRPRRLRRPKFGGSPWARVLLNG